LAQGRRSLVPNFTLIGPYLGISDQNKKKSIIFFLLDFCDIYVIYAGFGSVYFFQIRYISVHKSGSYRQKTAMWQIPNFWRPLAPKLQVEALKNCKMQK